MCVLCYPEKWDGDEEQMNKQQQSKQLQVALLHLKKAENNQGKKYSSQGTSISIVGVMWSEVFSNSKHHL